MFPHTFEFCPTFEKEIVLTCPTRDTSSSPQTKIEVSRLQDEIKRTFSLEISLALSTIFHCHYAARYLAASHLSPSIYIYLKERDSRYFVPRIRTVFSNVLRSHGRWISGHGASARDWNSES